MTMNLDALNAVAAKMVAKGKGILAADESTGEIFIVRSVGDVRGGL